jgi:hypothetical protein
MTICIWYQCRTPSSEIERDLADVAILCSRLLAASMLLSTARAPTVYLLNGGLLEYAQQMAAHQSARTTKLYDRRNGQVTLDQVERIVV